MLLKTQLAPYLRFLDLSSPVFGLQVDDAAGRVSHVQHLVLLQFQGVRIVDARLLVPVGGGATDAASPHGRRTYDGAIHGASIFLLKRMR